MPTPGSPGGLEGMQLSRCNLTAFPPHSFLFFLAPESWIFQSVGEKVSFYNGPFRMRVHLQRAAGQGCRASAGPEHSPQPLPPWLWAVGQ